MWSVGGGSLRDVLLWRSIKKIFSPHLWLLPIVFSLSWGLYFLVWGIYRVSWCDGRRSVCWRLELSLRRIRNFLNEFLFSKNRTFLKLGLDWRQPVAAKTRRGDILRHRLQLLLRQRLLNNFHLGLRRLPLNKLFFERLLFCRQMVEKSYLAIDLAVFLLGFFICVWEILIVELDQWILTPCDHLLECT